MLWEEDPFEAHSASGLAGKGLPLKIQSFLVLEEVGIRKPSGASLYQVGFPFGYKAIQV